MCVQFWLLPQVLVMSFYRWHEAWSGDCLALRCSMAGGCSMACTGLQGELQAKCEVLATQQLCGSLSQVLVDVLPTADLRHGQVICPGPKIRAEMTSATLM